MANAPMPNAYRQMITAWLIIIWLAFLKKSHSNKCANIHRTQPKTQPKLSTKARKENRKKWKSPQSYRQNQNG